MVEKQKKDKQEYICEICLQQKIGYPTRMRVDAPTLPRINKFNLVNVCQSCKKEVKAWNPSELITPEISEKYPYSEDKEILAKEFGIKSNE